MEQFFFSHIYMSWSQLTKSYIFQRGGEKPASSFNIIPIGSMYGIYANIGGILMVNVTIYSIHGSYGIGQRLLFGVKISTVFSGQISRSSSQNPPFVWLRFPHEVWENPNFVHVQPGIPGRSQKKHKIYQDFMMSHVIEWYLNGLLIGSMKIPLIPSGKTNIAMENHHLS